MTTEMDIWLTANVEFVVHPGHKGHCDKYGAPEEPDEDPEVEIKSVVVTSGDKSVDLLPLLSDEQIEELVTDIEQNLEGDYDEGPIPTKEDY